MDERLRQVAAQLALRDVVLLGEQPGGPHAAAVALEPAQGASACRPADAEASARWKPQSRKAPSASPQGPVVAGGTGRRSRRGRARRHRVAGWPRLRGSSAGTAPRIAGQQQRGVDAGVVGSALPAAVRVQAVASRRRRGRVGEAAPDSAPVTAPARPATARSPAAQISREWVQRGPRAPRSRRRARRHRCSIAATATSAARQSSASSRSWRPPRRAAAASRRRRRAGTGR